MRPQLRTSSDQRRRSSVSINSDSSLAIHLLGKDAKRRSSNVSCGSAGAATGAGSGAGQFLAVPGHTIRRSSLSTSTSALLGLAEGSRKRGSFTSALSSGSLLAVPQDTEPRRRSLPGYMDGVKPHPNSHSSAPAIDRRRSSVRPEEVYRQINDAGTRKMKIFGVVMIFFLAFVIGVSFLKLLH